VWDKIIGVGITEGLKIRKDVIDGIEDFYTDPSHPVARRALTSGVLHAVFVGLATLEATETLMAEVKGLRADLKGQYEKSD
jgi:hypothetical protein